MLLAAVAALVAVGPWRGQAAQYTIVRQLPHDTAAYTQGLVYAAGIFFESDGLYGQSRLRRVDPASGRTLASVPLAADRFGEGLALAHGRLIQLTWKEQVAYVYDAATLARVDSFRYRGEGWGLAFDGRWLIMSDGTANLRFLDPLSGRVVRQVAVQDGSLPLTRINELEYVRGELLANVYQSDRIVRIDPATGAVLGWIDLADLMPRERRTSGMDVLNGIAWDEATGHLFVTGKRWPTLFELALRPAPGPVR
jgi:glutamine cyclotransferase